MTTRFFDDVDFFAIIHPILLGCLLLVRDRLLLALPGARVVLRALTADRKTDTVTDSSVATDIHETFDVHLDAGTEFAFNLVLVGDEGTDGSDLLVIPLSDLDVVIDSAIIEELPRGTAANTEAIGKTYLSSFVDR